MTGSGAVTPCRCPSPSPDRVPAPCPVAGPGLCGGCDFQHVSLPAQRRLKAAVVREQLRRLAGLEVDVTVEAVPGDVDGLRWRTRQRYVELPDGRRGMRKHRSHDVVPIDDCLLEAPGPPSYSVLGRTFSVAADGFWQVHPGAPRVLVETVLEALDPQPGESALDLYAGVGLFAAFLADAVLLDGPGPGVVTAIEADGSACSHAERNLGDRVRVVRGPVDRVLDVRRLAHGRSRRPRPAPRGRQAPGRGAGRRPVTARGRLRCLRPGGAGP